MKKSVLLYLLFFVAFFLLAEDPVVSIYDEFDDGLFGKSIHRGVIVSVKKTAFTRSETFKIENEGESGYLTAVIISSENADKLEDGYFELEKRLEMGRTIYKYNRDGLSFEFSIEKAGDRMIDIVREYYKNDEMWRDPLVEYYTSNYVIRIHSTENVFDSWSDEITYNEALVTATLIGDSSQWLWGIHDGSDILNKGY
jgi:hypothetical protein